MDITIDCKAVDTSGSGTDPRYPIRVTLTGIDTRDLIHIDTDLLDIIGEEAARKHFGIKEGA